MIVTFLTSSIPICKSYERNLKEIKYTPYPNIYEFTSHTHGIGTIEDLYQNITKYAAAQGCVLKGCIQRELVKESRAGSTDADTPTEWVCLDVDGIENVHTIEELLHILKLGSIDYIIQWSSSMGIENKSGLRCHIFMLLDKPQSPLMLKQWLKGLNLNIPVLNRQLTLTKTGNALRWPLDITTCQNDKLLYIAPPTLKGIDDPYPGNRIELVKHKHRAITDLGSFPDQSTTNHAMEKRINELRLEIGAPKRQFKLKFSGSTEYMAAPGRALLTGRKLERGFMYFNLSGGDSWGYYHPEDKPDFIYNFKGEPTYRTQDLLPDYWAEVMKQDRPSVHKQAGKTYLAFREADSAKYFNAEVDNALGTIKLFPATKERHLDDFMILHGQPPVSKHPIPILTTIFNPQSTEIYNESNQTINTYSSPELKAAPGLWPTIRRVIDHVVGDDAAAADHFLNWLGCAVQRLDSNGTAWIWHGTFGTGKGILYHKVLTPIFGINNVVAKRMEELESEFSGYMENKFIVFIDEMEQGRSLYHSKIEAKLKNLITDPMISIRGMYREARMAHNFSNMIFASNNRAPVMVRPDDRRFNVGNYQAVPLLNVMTSDDIERVDAEVPHFLHALLHMGVDRDRARMPMINAARAEMIDTNRVAIDEVSDAINKGNLEFFWNLLLSETPTNPLVASKYEPFKTLVLELITTPPLTLTREELRVLYSWAIGEVPESPHKFTALLKHHHVFMEHVWKNNRTIRGIKVTWSPDTNWLTQARSEITQNLVP